VPITYHVPSQAGRRFVVTGSNSGTGKEAARRLAMAGARVVMAVRSVEKGEAARADILRDAPGAEIEVRSLDLADLASVRAFADGLVTDGRPVDVLVNNAGVMAPRQRFETADGFELQLGTNYLGPFALTNLLLPLLLTAPAPRVATMSSGTANFGRLRFADLQSTRAYSPSRAYAQSKLADMMMARQLARVADERGWPLLSTFAHPGYTLTNLQTAGVNLTRAAAEQLPPRRRSLLPSQGVEAGAEPLLVAATSPDARQGTYYGPGGSLGLVGPTKVTRIPRTARSLDTAARLWAVAEELTGTPLPTA
jgi:NAD(P)-dependent dehydrogenase (short-subunit alcohol dehydrogenase family)